MVIPDLKRIIIAAVSANNIIGKNNQIPWNSKEEIHHFKSTTLGSAIIMGRRTYESFNGPLPNRLNIIISKKVIDIAELNQTLCFESVGKAYRYLRNKAYNKVYIIGGGTIYRNTIRHAEEMIISHMKISVEGDVLFPRINPEIWKIHYQKDYKDFILKYYVRKK